MGNDDLMNAIMKAQQLRGMEKENSRRKTKLETVRFYALSLELLFALPDSDFKRAMSFIMDEFDKIQNRYADRTHPPTHQEIPMGVTENEGYRRIIARIVGDMYFDINEYWRRADQNSKNRTGDK